MGLKRNVRHLYAFLSRNWKDGDRIYAFGFSRGAYTARCVAHGREEARQRSEVISR